MAKENARERPTVGPKGEPVGSKGTDDGMAGSGPSTGKAGSNARPGRGSWVPSQGSAGKGMPAQRPGRALEPGPEPKETPASPKTPPPTDAGM